MVRLLPLDGRPQPHACCHIAQPPAIAHGTVNSPRADVAAAISRGSVVGRTTSPAGVVRLTVRAPFVRRETSCRPAAAAPP
jgi:hypothetical protein